MNKFLMSLIAVLVLQSNAQAEPKPVAESKVLMIINEGFWAPEYYEPRKIFEQAGFKITVAARSKGNISPDRRNAEYSPVTSELSFSEVNISNYDAVTFAGGNGAWTDYFPAEEVHKILTQAMNRDMVTALICSATGLLGVANNFDGLKPIAEGRHVTGYYRVEGLLRNLGKVNYDAGVKDQPHVVTDKNLVTGRDPISAKLFAETVRDLLAKKKK